MNDYWILEDRAPRRVTMEEWLLWQRNYPDGRRIGYTEVGEASVSTVFLSLDHAYPGMPPVLFETMVFNGPLDGEMERYRTIQEAEAGHEQMVQRVKEGTP